MIKKSIKSILADNWYEGIIIKGRGRGKTLGFPTINLKPLNFETFKLFDYGVYSCQVKINNKIHQGLLHYGPRPTFKEKDPSLEIHLLSNLCHPDPEPVERERSIVQFKPLKYLRPIKKFKTKEALTGQIKKDSLSMVE